MTENTRSGKRKCILIIGIILSVIITLLAPVLFFLFQAFSPSSYYETTNIADYGNYKGNNDNKSVREFINSFFPEEISSDFENPKYIYRAKKFDAYAFEAYLEFTISDENTFQHYLKNVTNNAPLEKFEYDKDFFEYVIADELTISMSPSEQKQETPGDYAIQYAKIGKILFNEATNTVIYIALGVYDGGGVRTDYLCEYFTRFQIDPVEYDEVYQRKN